IDAGEAEDMVDLYLEEVDEQATPPPPKPIAVAPPKKVNPKSSPSATSAAVVSMPSIDPAADRAQFPNFLSAVGTEMLLVPSGTFQMGSEAQDAAPNEGPITQVTLCRFYLSRHLITNAQYEMFDPDHVRKRAPGTGDHHPVVYVSSADAMK